MTGGGREGGKGREERRGGRDGEERRGEKRREGWSGEEGRGKVYNMIRYLFC